MQSFYMTELGPLPFCVLGSFIQYLFMFLLPSKAALLPTAFFGLFYLFGFFLTVEPRNGTRRSSPAIEKKRSVLMGRHTAQPPNADGSPVSQ